MKKRFLVPVALVAALALAACGKANTKTANDTKADTANEAAASGDTKELAIQVALHLKLLTRHSIHQMMAVICYNI